MIYYISYGADRRKYVTPVLSAEDFNSLRNSDVNINNVRLAREGDKDAKCRLVQFCYNSLHPTDKLAGESYLNRFFAFDYDDPATRETFINKVSDMRSELGALMLERSVHGAHAIFLRHNGESIEEGCQRISRLTGFPYDKNCKDLNRVIFGTTSRKEDLIFCYDALFEPVDDWEEAKRETEEVQGRTSGGTRELRDSETQENGTSKIQNSQNPSIPTELTPQQREIIEGCFRLADYEPSEITEGTREMAMFAVSMKLRHWAGFSEDKILPLLYPHYSYGLTEKEVRGAIRSALNEERGYAPKALKSLIERVEGRNIGNDTETKDHDLIAQIYRPFEDVVAEEVSMPEIPRLMKTLLKAAPYGYKYAVMAAIAPAACTLLSGIRMKYGTKAPKRMNAWTHLDGLFASNKSLMVQPIRTLLYELQQQDDANEKAMNEVKLRNHLNHNKESLEKVPELPVRIVGAGVTRKQHIIMMKNAQGLHTYTMSEELSSLKINSTGYYNRGDFALHMFDNSKVSTITAVDDTPNVVADCMWNLSTSSTRVHTLQQWRTSTDGGVSRVWFVLMPDSVFAPKPKYYQYSEAEKEYISRASLIMMKLHGLLLTPKLDEAMDKWDTDTRIAAKQAGNRARAMLKNRAQEIAHTFGGVLHCMDAVQQIIKREDEGFATEEERLEWEKTAYDPNNYKEQQHNTNMAIFCANRILDEQESLWGRQIMEQTLSACSQQTHPNRGSSDYLRLPSGEFTVTDIEPLFPGKRRTALNVMLSRFCMTGQLMRRGKQDKKTIYQKAA